MVIVFLCLLLMVPTSTESVDRYATRCREISIGRAFGPKAMHEDAVFTVNGYSIVLMFGNKNDTKHINSEATWSTQLTSAGAL